MATRPTLSDSGRTRSGRSVRSYRSRSSAASPGGVPLTAEDSFHDDDFSVSFDGRDVGMEMANPVTYHDDMRQSQRSIMRPVGHHDGADIGTGGGSSVGTYSTRDLRSVSGAGSAVRRGSGDQYGLDGGAGNGYGGGGGGGYYVDDRHSHNNSTIATGDDNAGPDRLYLLCEMAMPLGEQRSQTGHPLTPKEVARRRERLDTLWEGIREWIQSHPSVEERQTAAQYQGQFFTTALHMVCKLPDPPVDVVELLVECSVDTVTWADSNGWLPLHHACANGASSDVLDVLVRAHPEGKITQDKRRRTPLHFAFFRTDIRADEGSGYNSGLFGDEKDDAERDEYTRQKEEGNSMRDIVQLLSDSGAAELQDENGMLPLHYACAYGTSTAVLEVLADAYYESIVAREAKGRTPLHLAMVNAHRSASPNVVTFLLLPRSGIDVVNMADRNGHLPINSLANLTGRLGPEHKDGRTNASLCLQMYLQAKPRATADFLTALQALPEWLRDTAVVSPHVQDILNEKIVKRFPTSILMLDGYMLILIIACFDVASREHIDYRFTGAEPARDGTIVAIFFGATYFLLRELVQIMSLWSLGTFRSWLTDASNWLDMLLIVLVFYYTSAMVDSSLGSDDAFRTGVAVTKGILWASVISFLKSTLVDFAVFVGGVLYVLRRLAAFLLALGVILLAFAQMFLIVYKETGICNFNKQEDGCETPGETVSAAQYCYNDFPHCNFPDSLLKVYTMLMGEIGDESRYATSNIAQFLYVTFAFLVVILLSNVLIAIVTDSYGVIRNERAAMVFWSNRLDFVAEMDAISSAKQRIQQILPFGGGGGEDDGGFDEGNHLTEGDLDRNGGVAVFQEDIEIRSVRSVDGQPASSSRNQDLFRDEWMNLMSLFDSNLYDDIDLHPGSFEFWCYFFFRIFAIIFIIPLWLVAGAATTGWLWPPQVREWLFVQKKTQISRADLAKQVISEINQLKDEIKELRFELKGEMKNDRREVVQTKAEMEGVQASVMSDLLQVKEIMTSLLEMGRAQAKRQEERASAAAIAAARMHHE